MEATIATQRHAVPGRYAGAKEVAAESAKPERAILARQQSEGWGAKVIDRLSADLRVAFPDMQGLSPRNLKYMRSFAAAWPDSAIVQRVIAQLPWRQNIALLDKLGDAKTRHGSIFPSIRIRYTVRSQLKMTTSHPTDELQAQFAESAKLEQAITANLRGLGYGG